TSICLKDWHFPRSGGSVSGPLRGRWPNDANLRVFQGSSRTPTRILCRQLSRRQHAAYCPRRGRPHAQRSRHVPGRGGLRGQVSGGGPRRKVPARLGVCLSGEAAHLQQAVERSEECHPRSAAAQGAAPGGPQRERHRGLDSVRAGASNRFCRRRPGRRQRSVETAGSDLLVAGTPRRAVRRAPEGRQAGDAAAGRLEAEVIGWGLEVPGGNRERHEGAIETREELVAFWRAPAMFFTHTSFGRVAPMLVGIVGLPVAAFAQAWVPEKGDTTVSLAVQELNVKKHLSATQVIDAGHINTVVLLTDATYGLTSKMAVDLAVPFVSTTYAGTRPHPGAIVDDGTIHNSFTDLRFSVRYNVSRKGVVLTPYVGSIVPSHDYAYYGQPPLGERLRESQSGRSAAKLFPTGVPGLFVSGRAAYGFVEQVQDISHNRSMGDLEVGSFATPAFRAFAMANGQYPHGGVDLP